jgi:branched-chain amino acid transport system permease protein
VSLTVTNTASGPTARQVWIGAGLLAGALLLWMIFGIWPDWLDGLLGGKKTFVSAILNGVTLAGLYFLVASGFTLVFGLMRNVNLAHGSLFLLGAASVTTRRAGAVRRRRGSLAIAAVGALLQILSFKD